MGQRRVAEDAGALERPEPADRRQHAPHLAATVLALQRSAGNRAVTRLLRARLPPFVPTRPRLGTKSRRAVQRQRLPITYADHLYDLDEAPSKANIQSYVERVHLVTVIGDILKDERIDEHRREAVRQLKDELNRLLKGAKWNEAATTLSRLVDEINLIPVHEPRQIVHRAAHGSDIVSAAADNMDGPCAQMIAAFPVGSVEGNEGAGSIVVVEGDKTVKRMVPGHVKVALGSKYFSLRIDIQGSHVEDKGGGKQVRCVRFALQYGSKTYASIIVERNKDFGTTYLQEALRESMARRTQAHVYMD